MTTLLFKRPNGTFYKMDKEYLQDASGNPTGKVNMKETDVSATDANGYKPTYVSKGEFYVNRGDKDNAYSINGTPVSSGNVFRLQNDLNPVYRTVYYYAKPEPVKLNFSLQKHLQVVPCKMVSSTLRFKIQQVVTMKQYLTKMVRLLLVSLLSQNQECIPTK